MFTSVHRAFLSQAVICALLLTSALPLVARSQVSSEETSTATSAPAEPLSADDQALENAYPTEMVPGGGTVGDFVVGPGKVDLTIKPGESKTVEMNITNRTGERRKFNINYEDAEGTQDVDQAIVLLGDDRGPYSVKDYISVPHQSFILDHNERARVPVTITVPKDAEPGGLYGSVLVDTVAIEAVPGDTAGTAPQSAIVARIGMLLFITIPGAVEKDGNLKDFSTIPKQTFFQEGPIKFGILFENRGIIHLAPYGELRITNMFGEEIGYQELEPWFVLPKSLRLREISWNREVLFGRYTATVNINRSYDDTVDTMQFSFWVLPWKPLALVFVGLFIVFFIIRAFFRNFEFKRKA